MADNQRAKHGDQQPQGNRDAQKQGDQTQSGPQGDRDRTKGQENHTDKQGAQSGQTQGGKQGQNR